MSDQPQQPGDAAPSASGEGVPSTGTSTSADGVHLDADDTHRRAFRRWQPTRRRAGEEARDGRTTGCGDARVGRRPGGRTTGRPSTPPPQRPDAGDVYGQQSAGRDDGQAPLFAAEEGDRLRGEWESVQAAFVDDPRAAVQRADALVSEVVQNLTESFTTAQSRLEQQWSQGEDVSTEDLRQALHRYRSFFERLLRL